MSSYAKVILMGRCGQDPELRYTTAGKAVAEVSVATDYGTGENKKTSWFKVIAWEKQAELLIQYFTKGKAILVEGRLQQRTWETDEGQKRSMVEIIAERIVFLPRNSEEAGPGNGSGSAGGGERQTSRQEEPRREEPRRESPRPEMDVVTSRSGQPRRPEPGPSKEWETAGFDELDVPF